MDILKKEMERKRKEIESADLTVNMEFFNYLTFDFDWGEWSKK